MKLKNIAMVFAAVMLANCGGGGGGGVPDLPGGGGGGTDQPDLGKVELNPDVDPRRMAGYMKLSSDMTSIFALQDRLYLEGRASSGQTPCLGGGTYEVKGSAESAFTLTYKDCDVTWTVLNGTEKFVVDGKDLKVDADLRWDDIVFKNKLTLNSYGMQAHSPEIYVSVDDATISFASGEKVSGFILIAQTPSGGTSECDPIFELKSEESQIRVALIGPVSDGMTDAICRYHFLDGTGDFVRFDAPFKGNLNYERGDSRINTYSADIEIDEDNFVMDYDFEGSPTSTPRTHVATADGKWSDGYAHPYYTLSD